MKHLAPLIAVLVLAATSLALVGSRAAQAEPRAAQSHVFGVRAEYVELSSNLPVTYTTCHLANRSVSSPIVIDSVRALGPGGRDDLLAGAPSLAGVVIPPLGQLRFGVRSSIFGGLQPQTSSNGAGARTVVVAWTGAEGTLDMTSVIVRYPTGSVDRRTSVTARAFEVAP